jgi:hypothetical protein
MVFSQWSLRLCGAIALPRPGCCQALTLVSLPKLEEWALRVPGTRSTMCNQAATLNRSVRLFFSTSGFFFYANDVLHSQ